MHIATGDTFYGANGLNREPAGGGIGGEQRRPALRSAGKALRGGSGNVRRLLDDRDALVAEYDTGGALLDRYIHGLGAGDDPLFRYQGSSVGLGHAQFHYTDRLGSVIARNDRYGTPLALNAYDGSAAERAKRGQHGVPGPPSGVYNNGRFRYTVQIWIPELGLYYYKPVLSDCRRQAAEGARMYSPTTGRFMQTDPIGYADGMNMYRYAANDPINFVDPTGTEIVVTGVKDDDACPKGWACVERDEFIELLRLWGYSWTPGEQFDGFGTFAYQLATGKDKPQNDENLVDRAKDKLCDILDWAPGDGVKLGVRLGGGLGLLYYGESYLRVSDAGRISITHSNSLAAGGGLIAGALVSPFSREPVEGIQDSTGTIFSVAALGAITNYARGKDFDVGSVGGVLGFGETRTRTKNYLNLDCKR